MKKIPLLKVFEAITTKEIKEGSFVQIACDHLEPKECPIGKVKEIDKQNVTVETTSGDKIYHMADLTALTDLNDFSESWVEFLTNFRESTDFDSSSSQDDIKEKFGCTDDVAIFLLEIINSIKVY